MVANEEWLGRGRSNDGRNADGSDGRRAGDVGDDSGKSRSCCASAARSEVEGEGELRSMRSDDGGREQVESGDLGLPAVLLSEQASSPSRSSTAAPSGANMVDGCVDDEWRLEMVGVSARCEDVEGKSQQRVRRK